MKIKMTRQGITVLGLAAMLLGLTACGKQAGIEKSDASYVASFYDIPDTVTGISRLLIKDNAAYMCCSEANGVSYLASMTVEDGGFQKLTLTMEASASLLDFAFDPKGNIWAVTMEEAEAII